jgi:hypothetical protein
MLCIWQVILALAVFASIVLADPQNNYGRPTGLPRVTNSRLQLPGATPVPPVYRNPAVPPRRVIPPRIGGRPGDRVGRQVGFRAFASNIIARIQNATRNIPTAFASNILAPLRNATRNIPGVSTIFARLP